MKIKEKIDQYLTNEEYDELYDFLTTKVKQENSSDEELYQCYYNLGKLFMNYRFSKRNEKRSSINLKRALSYNSTRVEPYLALCKVESDDNVTIKYLKEANKVIPNNPYILSELYSREKNESIKQMIVESKIEQSDELFVVLGALYKHRDYTSMNDVINKNADKLKYYKDELVFLYFLQPYIELKIKNDLESVIRGFLFSVDKDLNNSLQYLPNIYLAKTYFDFDLIDKSIENLINIPISNTVSAIFDGPFFPFYLELQDEIISFLSEILTKVNDKKNKMHIKALKTIIKVNPLYLESSDFLISDAKALEDYFRSNGDNYFSACTAIELYHQKQKNIKSIKLAIELLKLDVNLEQNDVFMDTILEDIKEKDLSDIVQIVMGELSDFDYSNTWEYDTIISLIDPVISLLFRSNIEDKYEYISNIAHLMKNDDLYKKSSKLFELAYSLSKMNNKSYAEEIYEYSIITNGETSAVLNNLAVIYNDKGKYIDALNLYQKAYDLDPTNEVAKNNLKKTQRENTQRRKVIDKLFNDNLLIFSLLLDVMNDLHNKFLVNIISYQESSIAKYFNQETFYRLLSENYFEKINEKQENEYQINLYLLDELEKYKQYKILSNSDYIMNNLSLSKLRDIGVTQIILDKLIKINDPDLREIIINDFVECIVSVYVNNVKSSIVLMGSIIEAVFSYLLKINDIEKIKRQDNKVVDVSNANLFDIIEFCNNQGYISGRKYHFAHILKDYRNLVHPNKIIREKLKLSKNDVELTWNSILILIETINF